VFAGFRTGKNGWWQAFVRPLATLARHVRPVTKTAELSGLTPTERATSSASRGRCTAPRSAAAPPCASAPLPCEETASVGHEVKGLVARPVTWSVARPDDPRRNGYIGREMSGRR
jgi:hypothetical protein